MKFAFSGLVRQLPLTWPIPSGSYEYCSFSIKGSPIVFIEVTKKLTKSRHPVAPEVNKCSLQS